MVQESIPDDGDTPVVVEEGEGAEPDLQTQLKNALASLETRRAEAEKLSNDLAAMKGQIKRQENIEEVIAGFGDRFDGFEAEVRSGFKSIAEGSADTLVDDMTAARRPYDSRVQRSAGVRLATSTMDNIDEALLGQDGKPLLDKETAPELAGVRTAYNAALKHAENGDMVQAKEQSGLAENLTVRAARAAERKAFSQSLETRSTELKAAQDKWEEENGVGDLSVGIGSASVGGNLLGKLGDPAATVSRDDIVKAAE